MNVTMKLKLGEYQLVELRRLAVEAQTDVAGIIAGIITMYLNGQVQQVTPKRDARNEAFIKAVRAAVAVYDNNGREPLRKPEPTYGEPLRKGRPGRKPLIDDEGVKEMRSLRAGGASVADLAEMYQCSVPTVRRVCGSLKSRAYA